MITNLFKSLFSFNLATLIGGLVGLIMYANYTGSMPLPPLLFSQKLYLVCFIFVLMFHFFLWIFLDKASFFNFKNRIRELLIDYICLMFMLTCSCATAFLFNTFY